MSQGANIQGGGVKFLGAKCLGANVWRTIVLDPNNSKYIPLEVTISLVLQGIS